MISSKKYVDETLKANNLIANKALGQNFLVEGEIAKEIVLSANITNQTCVIEIGPGLGALTEFALEKAKVVKCFEIDSNMVKILSETFKEKENFEITNIDFLKVDLEELIKKLSLQYKDIVLLSNLPYYITSKLLNKALTKDLNIRCFVAMMQKEVGQKIVRPEKKDYNVLSVILDYQYDVSVVKYVGKNAYLPRPEIDSIVLKFEKIAPRYEVKQQTLLNVATALFLQRRKTVFNNLKSILKNVKELEQCLINCKIGKNTHIEQLSIENIVDISKYIEQTK